MNVSRTMAAGASFDMNKLDAGAVTINEALTIGGKVAMDKKLLPVVVDSM